VEALRELRRQRGLSQQELSRATGVAQNTISEIERGHREPQGSTLRKLARALDVEIVDLFRGPTLPKGETPYLDEREVAARAARKLRGMLRAEMDLLLERWREAGRHGAEGRLRRKHLDEIGDVLNIARGAETPLWSAELSTDEFFDRVIPASAVYQELVEQVVEAGLGIRRLPAGGVLVEKSAA
jgi:transcriptional regulator with XRE-family HTH domain